ncbi:hypothetical protein ACLKA7_009967 [Drosophila subpalustris]
MATINMAKSSSIRGSNGSGLEAIHQAELIQSNHFVMVARGSANSRIKHHRNHRTSNALAQVNHMHKCQKPPDERATFVDGARRTGVGGVGGVSFSVFCFCPGHILCGPMCCRWSVPAIAVPGTVISLIALFMKHFH